MLQKLASFSLSSSYQCKLRKNVAILSNLRLNEQISRGDNPKHKPDSVLYHNQRRVGVDVYDQMVRMHSVKAACRRWPVHVFYNIIDTTLINSWVIYQEICQSNISRREYMQKVAEELTESMPFDSRKRQIDDRGSSKPVTSPTPVVKVRRRCSTMKYKNRTTDTCQKCNNQCVGGVLANNFNFVSECTAVNN